MSRDTRRSPDRATLRVLHVGKYFPPFHGGMETYLRDLMLAMATLQVRCSALVHNHARSFRSCMSKLDTDSGQLTVLRAARWMNLGFAPISPGFPIALMRMIRREQPDVLHLHLPNASAFWALILPRARRLPWVVHWHSDVPDTLFESGSWLRPLARLYRSLERAVLRRSATIIVTSPPYLQSSPMLSAFREKCIVVPLGIPPPDSVETPAMDEQFAPAPGRRLRLLSVGRFSYYKGLSVLLEAISQVPDVELQLVGDGELKSELQGLAVALSIESRVTFCGSIPDKELEEAWAWCDCLCLPSIERTEAFGVVLLEAMSRGKACIVADVTGSGMGWVVEHGVTGLKVAPANTESLAESIRAAHADRAALERMGREGQARFRNQLDIAISAPQVRKVYEEVTVHE